jgi:hypothetical protein
MNHLGRCSVKRLSLAAATILFLVFGAQAEAATNAGWSVNAVANPAGASASNLAGVSCAGANSCMSVGSYTSGGVSATLTERWNGATWSVQASPNPSGGSNVSLQGVSCPAANACVAVGASSLGTLAEVWNGSSWSIQTTPNPPGASGIRLWDVSCSAASACTAVGEYQPVVGQILPLAMRWDGTSWTIQSVPAPAGGSFVFLRGISCASATSCVAVGQYNNASGQLTFAVHWNGTSWSIQTSPNPPGSTQSKFEDVSCTAANACTAVGQAVSGGTLLSLAERWNGTTWTIQTTPNPAGGLGVNLTDVSCISATTCTAAGFYGTSTGDTLTLAERWNGTSWAIQSTPNPTGAKTSRLRGISCTATNACSAVGETITPSGTPVTTLAQTWNGSTWLLESSANHGSSNLTSVSCASATSCAAVGTGTNILLGEWYFG